MPTVRELLAREDFFDAAVIHHGFVDYTRDYEIRVAGPGPAGSLVHRYLFVGCVEAHYRTRISPEVFARSLPDRFVYAGPDYPDIDDPDGYVWGTRWACAYPGLRYVDGGERAVHWTRLLARPMHEILLETNAYALRLVFADIRVATLGPEDRVGRPKDYPIPPSEEARTTDGNVT